MEVKFAMSNLVIPDSFGEFGDNSSCDGITPDVVVPVTKLRKKGFKVVSTFENGFKVKVVRQNLVAKLQKLGGTEYVERIVEECTNEEDCELKAYAQDHYWDVEQLSDNTFIIRRKQ